MTVIAVNFLVDNPWTHSLVKNIINSKLQPEIGYNVEFQAMSVTTLPPGIELYGLRLTDEQSKKVVLSASRINARLSVVSLMLGDFRLSALQLNELTYTYVYTRGEYDQGSGDVTSPEDLIRWPPSFKVPIESFVLDNSNITLRVLNPPDPTKNLEIKTSGISVKCYFRNWNDFYLTYDSPLTDVHFMESHVLQGAKVQDALIMKGNEIESESLSISSHDFNATGSLKTRLMTKVVYNRFIRARRLKDTFLDQIRVDGELDIQNSNLSSLGRFLKIPQTDGTLQGEAKLNVVVPMISDDDITWYVEGYAKVNKGKMDDFWMYDSSAEFHLTEDRVKFPNISLKKDGEVLGSANGTIQFTSVLDYDFRLHLDGIKFSEFLPAVKTRNFKVFDGIMHTEEFVVKGQGFPFNLETNGQVYLRDVTTPSLNYPHDRYPEPPDCLFDLNLRTDSLGLYFKNARATCFEVDPKKLGDVKPEVPKDSRHASTIGIQGTTWYDSAKGMNLKLSSTGADLGFAKYYAQVLTLGNLSFETTIEGPYSDLFLKTTFSGDSVITAGFPLGKIKGSLSSDLKGNQIDFSQITSHPPDGGFISVPKAFIKTDKLKTSDVTFLGKNLTGDFVEKGFQYLAPNSELKFDVTGVSGRLTGPIQIPLFYEGSVKFNLGHGGLKGQTLFHDISGTLKATKQKVTGSQVQYRLGSMRNKIDATYFKSSQNPPLEKKSDWLENIGGSWTDKIKLSVLPLKPQYGPKSSGGDFEILPWAGGHLKKAKVRGDLKAKLELEGPIRDAQGIFEIDVNNFGFLGSQLSPLRVKGFVKGSEIDASEIVLAGDALLGRVKFDWKKPGVPYQWFFKFRRFDIRALGSKFFYNDPRNYAYVNGSWSMEGELKRWWYSKGTADIESLTLKLIRDSVHGWKAIKLASEAPVTMSFDEEGWRFDDQKRFVVRGDEAFLSIGTEGNNPPEKLSINFEGEVQAGLLRSFLPKVESSRGVLVLNGTLKGSVKEADFEFVVEDKKVDPFDVGKWVPVAINFTNYPPTFNNIRLKGTYKNGLLEVSRLTADKGATGKIQSSGRLLLLSDPDALSNLNVVFDKLEFRRYSLVGFIFDTNVSGELSLTNNRFPFRLTGNVKIDRATSLGNFDIRKTIIKSIAKKKINMIQAPKKTLLDLNIRALADRSIKIRNRNIVATLSTDLLIRGSEVQPLITGMVEINEGKFFYKRDFNIKRGNIVFVAATFPPDPKLDIVASSNVSQYVVQTIISGYLSDPKVEITIDPPTRPDGSPISKVDILHLLSRGTLPDESDAGALTRNEALNIAISQFEQPIERLFDLSGQTVVRQVYIDTTSDEEGAPVPRFNLPFHFGDDVKVVIQMVDQSNMKASTEYSVHDSISFTGSYENKDSEKNIESDDDAGVDLKFRFSFP